MIAIKLMDTTRKLSDIRKQWEEDSYCSAPEPCWCVSCRAGAGIFRDGEPVLGAFALAMEIEESLRRLSKDRYFLPYAEDHTGIDRIFETFVGAPCYRTGSRFGEYYILVDGIVFAGRANSYARGSEYVSINADIIVTSQGFATWDEWRKQI